MKIKRDLKNKVVAGVCAGLANYFHWEVWRVRIVFLVSILFGGFGVIAYLVLWFLIPADGEVINL